MHHKLLARTLAISLILTTILLQAWSLNTSDSVQARSLSPLDNGTCHLLTPLNPFEPSALWTLEPGCSQTNPNQQVFVQTVVLQPDKSLVVYDPLVIDEGTTPAAPPVPYTPPPGSVIGVFGGGNDTTTILDGPGASFCTNGADGIPFGQVWFCGTNNLLSAILHVGIHIPSIGVDAHGKPCPTARSFKVVDQDQSDNVQTLYLLTPDGRVAQDNATNTASLPGSSVIANGSDNTLLTRFVDPAIGCHAWLLPDITNNMALQPSQAADELQGLAYQHRPVALIPLGDPMVGPNNLAMVNAYRSSLLQPTARGLGQANTQDYCNHLVHVAPAFFASYATLLSASPSPDPALNLHDFLVARFQASLQLLGCHNQS